MNLNFVSINIEWYRSVHSTAGCFLFVVGVVVTAIGLAAAVFLVYDACKRRNPPPQTLQVNGYDGAKSPYSSSNPESPLFIAAEKSSSIELGF